MAGGLREKLGIVMRLPGQQGLNSPRIETLQERADIGDNLYLISRVPDFNPNEGDKNIDVFINLCKGEEMSLGNCQDEVILYIYCNSILTLFT